MATAVEWQSEVVSHPFLAGAGEEFCAALDECGEMRSFAANEEIIEAETKADHFFLIFDGVVDLEKFVPGLGVLTIQRLGAGDVLGCSWLFPPYWWKFSAVARVHTEAMAFNGAALRARAAEDPEFAGELLKRFNRTLLTRLEAALDQLVDLSTLTAAPQKA